MANWGWKVSCTSTLHVSSTKYNILFGQTYKLLEQSSECNIPCLMSPGVNATLIHTIVSWVEQVLPQITAKHSLFNYPRLLQLDTLGPCVEEQAQKRDELAMLLQHWKIIVISWPWNCMILYSNVIMQIRQLHAQLLDIHVLYLYFYEKLCKTNNCSKYIFTIHKIQEGKRSEVAHLRSEGFERFWSAFAMYSKPFKTRPWYFFKLIFWASFMMIEPNMWLLEC